MNSKLLSILLLCIFAPVSFAAEISVAKKTPPAQKQLAITKQKTIVAEKKPLNKTAPKIQNTVDIKKKTIVKTPQKAPVIVKVEPKVKHILAPSKKPSPIEKKTLSKTTPKTQIIAKTEPKAKPILAPSKKPLAATLTKTVPVLPAKNLVIKTEKKIIPAPLKTEPEVLIKRTKPKAPCPIKNAPPAVTPSAIQGTDLRKIAKEASLELQSEENCLLGDLRILWQYAVENSETIKFAIYKLSDPKGDLKKADESKIKKLLKPIAGITPFVAATACNPIAAGTSIIGGTFMNDILSEDKYKKHLEKVTDADLVILAKAIEDLQNNLVSTYYEYTTAKKILEFADKNLQNRKQLCDSLNAAPEETIVIADTFYREALARQSQAQANLLLKRSELEQLVGNDAILLIESNKKQPK